MKNLLIIATCALYALSIIAIPLPEQQGLEIVQIPLKGNKVSIFLMFF